MKARRRGLRLAGCALLAAAGAVPSAHAQAPSLSVCDARLEAPAPPPDAAYCYLYLASAGHVTFEAAAAHVDGRLAAKPGDPLRALALATLLGAQNRPDADGAYPAAIAAFARDRHVAGEIIARTGFAGYLRLSGRNEEAEAALAPADRLAETSGNPNLVARTRIQQAWLAYARLDYGRGLRIIDGIVPAPDPRDVYLRSQWLSARGALLWAVGRWFEARASYVEQAALLEQAGNYYEGSIARTNITLLTGGPARRAMALEAAAAAKKGGNLRAEASAYFYLSELGGDEALSWARRSLDVSVRSRSPTAIARAQRAVALSALEDDPDDAFRMIEASIATARAAGDPNEAVRSRFVKANMRWEAGPRPEAIADSLSLLDAIEALRGYQPEEAVRAQRFGQWRFGYYRLAGHLLAGRQSEAGTPTAEERELAFTTIERMRARVLLDRLDEAGASFDHSGHPLADERVAILKDIAALNRRLPSLPRGGREFDEAIAALDARERLADDVTARLARLDPAFGSVHVPELATLAEIRDALGPDEAMVTFQVSALVHDGAPFGSWVWTITRNGAQVKPLEVSSQLAEFVDLFVGLLHRRDASEASAAARLYDDVMATALDGLPPEITRLVIVPDDALHRLPFDALRATADGAPLAARFSIGLAPSATTWLRWRGQLSDASRGALIFADPELRGAADPNAGAADGWAPLPPLPDARYEGGVVKRALGKGSRLLSGSGATEGALKATDVEDYRILHFAAHAVIDDRQPGRSAVILASGDDTEEDGRLQVREIVDLPLSGQLVILSACRSAGGALIPGEGALGLAHAFLRSGASAVVASLWPVRDGEAAALMRLVGEGLGRGLTTGAAVAAARRHLMAAGAPTVAWAGLVVIGDANLVPVPGGRGYLPPWWTLGAAACALVAIGSWIARLRANARPTSAVPSPSPL